MKHHDNVEFKTTKDKIDYFTDLRNQKRKELEELRGIVGETVTKSNQFETENNENELDQ
jgi:hypothetical protein